jgi:hypothetical protein
VALTLSVALSGPASGADSHGLVGDDAASRTELRKTQATAPERPVTVSRRAQRNAARAEEDAPLSVTIDQLTPSTIPDEGVVRVSGTVTNNDDVPWGTINLRPFVSEEPLTSSAQLEEAAAMPADAVVGERINDERYKDFVEQLAPGDSEPYTFSIPRRMLGASTPGVYWFGVHALGENLDGRDEFADGRARTFLPLVPEAREGTQPTAVVIPLRHQLLYTADGSLDDLAGWTRTLSPGGRLRSLLDFGAAAGGRTLTWVVDPGLVDAVRRIAEGNPPRSLEPNLRAGQDDGEDDETTDLPASGSATATDDTEQPIESPAPTAEPENSGGSPLDLDELDPVVQAAAQAAQAWLARLGEAMRSQDQVLALPYGDVDVAAAAAQDPQLYQRAVARSGTTLSGLDVTTTPVVASPGGFLDTAGLRVAAPDATILLTDAMFDDQPPAEAVIDGREVLVTSTGAAEGGPGPDERTAVTAMRQRLLSEAAVRFLQRDRAPLTVVLAHDWNPSSGATFFAGLDADWLDLTSVQTVRDAATAEPVAGSSLRYPAWQQAAELDQASFDAANALIRSGAALQNLLSLNNLVSGTVTNQALGSTSYSARTRPIANRRSAEQSRAWISQRLAQVSVSAPRAVTLSSSSGQFGATITNRLDEPVTVALDAESDDRLAIAGPRRVEVPANGRTTVLLTARTGENGIHPVRLVLTDKRGTPLGATTSLSIRSAQVSNVIWLFLAIGAALMFGAIGVRLFRRVRGAHRGPTHAERRPSGDEPATSEDKEPAGAGGR